jgi:Lantibiotic biosynthesis dehydratase C-term
VHNPPAVEAWTEVNLVAARPLDQALLLDVVDPIVHGELADEIETWFFFWEPDLRLRIRWKNPEHVDENRRRLATTLDRAKKARSIRRWYEGAHGAKGQTYVGEAEHYGAEAWPRIQKDWMNGSELALTLAKLDRAGQLNRTREYHWQRHVHLVTNQLFGSWEAEIELCLRQALGYLKLRGSPTDEAAKLIAELRDFTAP